MQPAWVGVTLPSPRSRESAAGLMNHGRLVQGFGGMGATFNSTMSAASRTPNSRDEMCVPFRCEAVCQRSCARNTNVKTNGNVAQNGFSQHKLLGRIRLDGATSRLE